MSRFPCLRGTGNFSPPSDQKPEFDSLINVAISETSHLNKPSLTPAYTGQRVCAIVKCFRCERTRCVYAAKALTSACSSWLNDAIETRVYSCGSPLLEVGHQLEGKVYTKPLTCEDDIERAFYCSRLADGDVCSRCGRKQKTEMNEVKRKRLGLVLPVCTRCKSFECITK